MRGELQAMEDVMREERVVMREKLDRATTSDSHYLTNTINKRTVSDLLTP
jgi:hypothetical protein